MNYITKSKQKYKYIYIYINELVSWYFSTRKFERISSRNYVKTSISDPLKKLWLFWGKRPHLGHIRVQVPHIERGKLRNGAWRITQNISDHSVLSPQSKRPLGSCANTWFSNISENWRHIYIFIWRHLARMLLSFLRCLAESNVVTFSDVASTKWMEMYKSNGWCLLYKNATTATMAFNARLHAVVHQTRCREKNELRWEQFSWEKRSNSAS